MTGVPMVGVVGLGRMGMGLAQSLVRAGDQVHGLDADPQTVARATDLGIVITANVAEIAKCPTILLALPDGPDVIAVARALFQHAAEGTLIIDCSTVDPAVTDQLSQEAAERRVQFRDSAMAGGPADAAAGTLLFMVGCPESEFSGLERILRPIGRDVIRCGDTGAGVTLKVINNLLALSIFVADVEALLLARSANLDIETALDVLNSTGAANAAMTSLVSDQLLKREFQGAFRTSLALKDVRIAVDMAERLGVPLTTLAPTVEVFSKAVDEGYGELAAGAAGLVLEDFAGVTLADNV